MNSEHKTISAKSAADRLNLHVTTIRRWVREGTLPGKIITEGRERAKYLVEESAVNALCGEPDTDHINEKASKALVGSQKTLETMSRRFDSIDSEISQLKSGVFEEMNKHKRFNQDKKIESLINNQSKLYEQIKEVLNQFEHLSEKIDHLTIMKSINPPPGTSSPMQTRTPTPPIKQKGSWTEPNIKNVRR